MTHNVFTLQASQVRLGPAHQHLSSQAGPYSAWPDEFTLWAKVGRAMLKLGSNRSMNGAL